MLNIKFNINKSLGRNHGLISSYHRERGRKKLFRIVDFNRYLSDVEGYIVSIEKDSYRTGPVALVYYLNGVVAYILCDDKSTVGDRVKNFRNPIAVSKFIFGCGYFLRDVPVGEKIYNLELTPGFGGKISRSAGTFSVLIKKYEKVGLVRLTSGELRLFSLDCYCTLGRVGNVGHKDVIIGSAGKSRHLGRRPVVRGRAMNPVDHPHGGRTNGGVFPQTPWGKLTKGVKTRVRRTNSLILKNRKK